MEERTKLLVAIGAATAANCIPCFEHLHGQAGMVGLTPEEIQQVVDIATKVKQGAHVALKNRIHDMMGVEVRYGLDCFSESSDSCCG